MKLPSGYPRDCLYVARTLDGVRYRIRPIRPDDLAREVAFVRAFSEESRFNRLMYTVQEPTEAFLKPLLNVDYDRSMALVAVRRIQHRDGFIGVARYATPANRERHEFAVVVADEWQGRGVGTELLTR